MAEKVILEAQQIDGFAYNDSIGFFAKGASAWFDLEPEKTYRVDWDDDTFTCNAYKETLQGHECVFLGNKAYMTGESADITEPFLLYRVLENGYCYMSSIDTETSHDVGIYEVVEDTPSEPETPEEPAEPEQQEGIILKDRNGEDVAYYGIETVTFDTTTEGKQQVFTKGTVVPRLEVPVTFANGDMVITADPDVSLRELVLQKPADLEPENVRKDKNIGAITGTFIGDTEEITVDLNMVNGDQVIIPTADGKVISKVTVKKPETLIPDNIAEGVDIGGLIGALSGGGSGDWNCVIGVVTSDGSTADDTPIVVIPAEELTQKGIVLSTKEVTDLKTMIFAARISTGPTTSGEAKRINFAYFQNWQLSNNGSSTYYHGLVDYQSAATTVRTTETYMSSANYAISSHTYPVSLNSKYGLTVVRNQYSSYRINGTYIVGVIQHKTARVCDELS